MCLPDVFYLKIIMNSAMIVYKIIYGMHVWALVEKSGTGKCFPAYGCAWASSRADDAMHPQSTVTVLSLS